MTETSLVALRQLLLQGYAELKQRLTQRLGSPELAGEAIQDTWLRLQHTEAIGTVRSPANYLFRVALNLARDRLSADRRLSASPRAGRPPPMPNRSSDGAVEARRMPRPMPKQAVYGATLARQRAICANAANSRRSSSVRPGGRSVAVPFSRARLPRRRPRRPMPSSNRPSVCGRPLPN
jgi:DNA-directed RNA polymerase specialized sigma24 family protein